MITVPMVMLKTMMIGGSTLGSTVRRPQLQGDGHSGEDLPLHGPVAPEQGLTERTAQQDARHPAHVLDVGWDVQSHDGAQSFLLLLGAGVELSIGRQDVDVVAGEQPHREEHQHAQDEQRGDEQQQPPDDVGAHGRSKA